MKQLCFFLLLAITINGCKYNDPNLSINHVNSSDRSVSTALATAAGNVFEDGSYCATIQYNNSDNQISTCSLSVEIKNNELIKINSSDCDWLHEIHFTPKQLNETGSASFTGDKGNKYIITINEKAPLGSKKFQCDVCGKDIR